MDDDSGDLPDDDEPYPLTVGEFKLLVSALSTAYRSLAMVEFRSRARGATETDPERWN